MGVQVVGYRVEHEYGYGGWIRKKTRTRDVVATFDYPEDAVAYIKDSKLKNPYDRQRPFKKKSLLSLFEFVTIEVITKDYIPPYNPSMKRSK